MRAPATNSHSQPSVSWRHSGDRSLYPLAGGSRVHSRAIVAREARLATRRWSRRQSRYPRYSWWRCKETSAFQNWRPSPAVPPSPRRTSPRRVSKMPSGSGLIVIADRRPTLRVFEVADCFSARSHACATSMLKFQAPGVPASWPPIRPLVSSFGASKRERRSSRCWPAARLEEAPASLRDGRSDSAR